jgi:type II secretory pathway component PulF
MFSSKMSLREVAGATRRLGTGFRAGVDILRLLETETRSGRPVYREKISNVRESVRGGKTFAEAMLAEGKFFPPLMIQLVHAGEVGGSLDKVLLHLADYYDDVKQSRSAFFMKLAWPLVQLVLFQLIIGAVILIQGMLGTANNYDASGLGLSGLGGFLTYCGVLLAIHAVVITAILTVKNNWFNCQQLLFPIVQKIPVVGTPLVTLSLARFTMALSIMLNAGVDAIRSVKQAFRSTGNYFMMSGMEKAVEAIKKGDSYGEAFRAAGVFPDDFVEIVEIGEISGTETESLDRLAREYQERGRAALTMLAMAASGFLWFCMIALMVFIVMSLALKYINLINNAANGNF